MDLMLRPFWRHHGSYLLSKRIVVLDSLLTQLLSSQYYSFLQATSNSPYQWHPLLDSYIDGTFGARTENSVWFKDVDKVYAPMNWGNKHWVGLVISLRSRHIDILDPLIQSTSDQKVESYMEPLVKMLPHLIKTYCAPNEIDISDETDFTYSRLQGLAQNIRTGDCGPLAIKFIEMHSHGCSIAQMGNIPDAMVNHLRMQYAIAVYEECIGHV